MWIDPEVPLAWTVDDAFQAEEIAALRDRFQAMRWEAAEVNTVSGSRRIPDVRNNERILHDDPALADWMFARLEAHLPPRVHSHALIGLNERFRAYRYGPGTYFAPHTDGAFLRSPVERSFVTVMLYLNEGFEGGETAIFDTGDRIVPRAGRVLCFQHRLRHEGCLVKAGCKIALRTDAMYRRLNA